MTEAGLGCVVFAGRIYFLLECSPLKALKRVRIISASNKQGLTCYTCLCRTVPETVFTRLSKPVCPRIMVTFCLRVDVHASSICVSIYPVIYSRLKTEMRNLMGIVCMCTKRLHRISEAVISYINV